MNSTSIDAVLSGRQGGLSAALSRAALSIATPFYGAGVAARNFAFDRGWKRVQRVDIPVISVGNLTTGGTGKTPVVAWLVQSLQQLGRRPGILSRGYRSLDGMENDEKRLLDALCPGVPHVQDPDRVAGAKRAIAESHCDVLVLDDGFQHRRLARDLDIVLIDALNPWGYGPLLPRGLLREPSSSLRRAGLVLLTRADQSDDSSRTEIRRRVARWTSAPIAEVAFEPKRLINAAGDTKAFEELKGMAVGAFCGIGNPQAFRRTLSGIGLDLPADRFRVFPDHHPYGPADLSALTEWIAALEIEALIVTRKDLVKLPAPTIAGVPLWAVEIGVRWMMGQCSVEDRILATIKPQSNR